jgi:hypothetical protein
LPRPIPPLAKRLLVAFASLLLTFAALELAARLYMPRLAPTQIRKGVYRNVLPLLTGTGGRPISLHELVSHGERLAEEKPDDELRIFVTGESSVEGSPLDVYASMPAMLHDELRRALPDVRLKVVNLGRSSSIAANTFYYLLYMRRYKPDFVVFFMGMNDADGMPGEQCAPATSPRLHRVWRTMVRSSWALWLVRAYGPQLLWAWSGRTDWYPPKDCPRQTFPDWTRILAREARDMGAKAVIATPVASAALELEISTRQTVSSELPSLSPGYLRTLRCALEDSCDLSAHLLDALGRRRWSAGICESLESVDPPAPELAFLAKRCRSEPRTLLERHRHTVRYRAEAWRAAAEESGADYIDFGSVLEAASPHRILAERFFADRQHLLPLGYLYLARLVAARIEANLSGKPVREIAAPLEEAVDPYLDAVWASPVEVAVEQIARGWYVTGVPGLRFAVERFPPERCANDRRVFCAEIEWAEVTLGWLRKLAGLDPGVAPALLPRVESFEVMNVLEELRRLNREGG